MLRTTEFQGGLNFENSRRWKKKNGKIPGDGKNFDGIPGGGRKEYWKIPGDGEIFDRIPVEERKRAMDVHVIVIFTCIYTGCNPKILFVLIVNP